MANLKHWILEQADGEEIIGVVIGEMGWGDYNSEKVPNYNVHPRGKVIDWDIASHILNYEFDNGYGAPGCEAVYAWTENWVIAIGQYDGATWPYKIPRNPIDIMPTMEGGG